MGYDRYIRMSKTQLDKRFFESTRGQIVNLLRISGSTVNELADSLNLTDNAVRANLQTLERDGLVISEGSVKGFRKPHTLFRLTDEARHLFPKAYDLLLNHLIGVIKTRMPEALTSILHEVGTAAAGTSAADSELSLNARVYKAIDTLGELGGTAHTRPEEGQIVIKSESCPFADAVVQHPEVCQIAESLVAEIVGRPVTEICDRTSAPKCRFAIEMSV